VKAFKLNAQPLDAKAPLATQADDQLVLALPDLPRRQTVWPSAQLRQASFALAVVPPQPLAERRARNAEAMADRTRVTEFLVGRDPSPT
jgi:hypothetical protein